MKAFWRVCAVLSAFGINQSVVAATLDSIQGRVQVNSGSGFHQVVGATEVAPGTSVMASPGGGAEIFYSDGCRIPVRPGSVAVVAPISPCAQGQGNPGDVPGTSDNVAHYGVVGVAAFLLGLGIWEATKGHNDNNTAAPATRPASP